MDCLVQVFERDLRSVSRIQMAASGIQEHNEARRKERILMKRANWEKQFKHLNPSNEYVRCSQTVSQKAQCAAVFVAMVRY